ncbi:MAG: hypothetical protein PVH61_20125 [Candidatus Aminicenantes bacterium]|jgi:hypothetical protein
MPTILAASRSSVLLDGEPIEGLQSLTYKVKKNREDIPAIGTDERIDVSFGLKIVEGTLKVKSTNIVLNGHLAENSKFQVVANLKKELGISQTTQSVTFDDCFLDDKEFGIDANGVAVTTYFFTATRVREE